jgi:hypothetical protein
MKASPTIPPSEPRQKRLSLHHCAGTSILNHSQVNNQTIQPVGQSLQPETLHLGQPE